MGFGTKCCYLIYLVSSGIKIFLFLVVGTMLWFAFGMRTMSITHWCSYCWCLSRTFQLPTLWQWGGQQGAGRKQSQDIWPELDKGIFHIIEHHVQYINWESWTGGANPGQSGHWSAGGEQFFCVSLVFHGLYSHFLFFIKILFIIVIIINTVISFNYWNCSYLDP